MEIAASNKCANEIWYKNEKGAAAMKLLWKWIRGWVPSISIAMIVALLIQTNVVQAVKVPTGSMLPTIQLNDYLIVEKSLLVNGYLSFGDIVVFYPPLANNGSPSVKNSTVLTRICGTLNIISGCPDKYVKRLIGLPGDTIQVKDGALYRNGAMVDEPYIHKQMTYTFGPVTVPADHFLFLGDNRDASYDSHLWPETPFVDKKEIIGKVLFRMFPFNHLGIVS
jgi:signal peptidase I